eukprot:gene26641-33249_t
MSDNNKRPLITAKVADPNLRLLALLKTFLYAFINNLPEFGVTDIWIGGGGDDPHSAGLAIETLFHISFAYQSDADLKNKFMTHKSGIVDMLRLLQTKTTLRNKAKLSVNLLLDRLTESDVTATPPIVTSKAVKMSSVNAVADSLSILTRSHVVLSYCDDFTAQSALVMQLRMALTAKGYDVWMQNWGSTLVDAVEDGSSSTLKEALRRAHTVIVCISKEYKLSANCRMEATIAKKLLASGTVKSILFVMLQEEYTTDGKYVGQEPWMPMWNKELTQTAAVSVQEQLIALQANNPHISFGSSV